MSTNVTLRDVLPDDLPVFLEHQCDLEANAVAVFAAPNPSDEGAFRRRWNRILTCDGIVVRTILLNDIVAGHILLWRDPQMQGAEVSYWIAREHWGRGVATKALAAFLRVIRERPLFGRTAETNAGSLRVLERNGFVRVGTERAEGPDGRQVEEAIFRLER